MLIRSQKKRTNRHADTHTDRIKQKQDSRRGSSLFKFIVYPYPEDNIAFKRWGSGRGGGGDITRSTIHLCHTHHFTVHALHAASMYQHQTHVSTPFYQTRVQVASCYMYVLVKVLALFYQVLSSYMYELVLAYILLPILPTLHPCTRPHTCQYAILPDCRWHLVTCMYVLVLALFCQVISSYMYVLVLVYVLLPVLEVLRERNTQHCTGHAVHTQAAPCTSEYSSSLLHVRA